MDQKVAPSALARLEMAKEKARIAGKGPQLPSPLEQQAEEWQQQRERQQSYREPEGSPISITQMPLCRPQARPQEEEAGWRSHRWGGEDRPRQVRMNAAMVCSIAMRLRAREWARVRGKKSPRASQQAYDLEKWAERWKRERDLEARSLIKQQAG